MTTAVFIDGAQGTTGLEIRDRLAARADLQIIELDEARRKDAAVRAEALNAADIAILCLPDEAAREAVALVTNPRTRIIDASSAHRTAEGWTYGFPELGFDVANAARVSNPGCYPTGFLALVAPLVSAGLIPADWPYSVNAVSGYSGGGKALIARFQRSLDLVYPERLQGSRRARDGRDLERTVHVERSRDTGSAIAFRSYGLDLAHKHVPEMQRHAGLTQPPLFAPSVVRAYRGMIVEVPLPLAAIGRPSPAALRDELARFYQARPLVRVHDEAPAELLLEAEAEPTDRLDLYVFASPDGSQARLVALLDNLGKGAAGAAVQCLNLMSGVDELTGLRV